MKKKLKIIPLGGVKEIGSNMFWIQYDKTSFLIDCGILFPHDNFYDINYLIPDYDILDKNPPTDLIITHGHEDHIGAIEHLLRKYPKMSISASPFTKTLIEKKLEILEREANIKLWKYEESIRLGDIKLDAIHVNHSIPETRGILLSIEELKTSIFYISDFKVDLTATHEKPFDFEKLNLLSKGTSKILMADTTNILNEGKSASEDEVREELHRVIEQHQGRTFITLFASNIHRLESISMAAKKLQRKLYFAGRSIKTYVEVANKCNLINANDFIDLKEVRNIDRNAIVVLTGCQGEFRGATKRVVEGEHPLINLNSSTDLFIFSSKAIPGNEKIIYKLYNKLAEAGVPIITNKDAKIHATGHPGQADLKILIDKFEPNHFIPIHGESLFLVKAEEYIKVNFPQIACHLGLNYDTFLISEDHIHILANQNEIQPRIIHGMKRLEIDRSKISERRKMACLGMILISYPTKDPYRYQLDSLGLPDFEEKQLTKFRTKISNAIQKGLKNTEQLPLKEHIRIRTRRIYEDVLGYRPVVLVQEV